MYLFHVRVVVVSVSHREDTEVEDAEFRLSHGQQQQQKKKILFFIFTSIKKESNPLYFWRENNSVAAGQSLVGGEICQMSKSWVAEKKEKEK